MPGRWSGPRPNLGRRTWSNKVALEIEELFNRLIQGMSNLQAFPGIPGEGGAGEGGSTGTGPAVALADHSHPHSVVTPQNVGLTSAEGTDDSFVRGDHVHGIPAWLSRWTKYTVTHTGLQAAAFTNDVELFSLPAKGVILGVILKHSVAFAGAGITAYILSLGVAGELDSYLVAQDVFQAVGNTVFGQEVAFSLENAGAVTSIRLAATSTGAHLDQTSAGSVDIWVLWSTLP
jgi:hypothetical protein